MIWCWAAGGSGGEGYKYNPDCGRVFCLTTSPGPNRRSSRSAAVSNGPAAAVPAIYHALEFSNNGGTVKLLRLILLRRTQSRSVRTSALVYPRTRFEKKSQRFEKNSPTTDRPDTSRVSPRATPAQRLQDTRTPDAYSVRLCRTDTSRTSPVPRLSAPAHDAPAAGRLPETRSSRHVPYRHDRHV